MQPKVHAIVCEDGSKKSLLCKQEPRHLSIRELRCPKCGFLLQKIYSDARGHVSIKCTKCKQVSIMNISNLND